MSQSQSRITQSGAAWGSLAPSWPAIVGLLVFGRLLVARAALLNDPDTYLHIAAGRWILSHHALPVHDPFSHSIPGATWISSEWLAQIVLAAAYDRLGWNGVILLTAAAVAVALAMLTRLLLQRWPALPTLIAVAAATAVLQPHCLARPHILVLPILVLWAGLLIAARDHGRPPPFAALPLMLLWANLHGSFLFGLGVAAYLGLEAVLFPDGAGRAAALRRWGVFGLAAIAAALVTPHGLPGILEPIRLMTSPALQATFIEWRSPDFQEFPALEMWLLGLVVVGFTLGARPPPMRLVLLLGLIHMALQHVRHADILAIVAPLALAAPLEAALAGLIPDARSSLSGWFARLAKPAAAPAAVLTIAAALALAIPVVLHPLVRGDDAVTPAAALAAARHRGVTGPVLNSQMFGGYLAFEGVPTFIDGRIEMYGNAFLAEAFKAEKGNPAALKELLGRYRIAWTLLLPNSGAASAMDRLPGWERIYGDERAVVHRRVVAASG
jgi:hypothetical protein